MATTPNYGFTVYASTDTAVKFLDFRTSIAGTATSSNFYKIDTLLKTINNTLDTMDLVTATFISNNDYSLSISQDKLKNGYTFILKFSATNSGSDYVKFTPSNGESKPVYIGYGSSSIVADSYQFLPGYYYFCYYNGSAFYILGANSGKQITVKMGTVNNKEVLVCKKTSGAASPAIIETSGMPIGSAGGFATLDSSAKVVQTANSAINATNALHASSADSATAATTATNANKLGGQSPTWYMPTGAVIPYAGSTAPDGWLLCDGRTVSRTTYAALFAVIGTTYGAGDGKSTFALPDLRGNVPAGVTSGHALASKTGAETVTLTASQIPSHQHSYSGYLYSGGAENGNVTSGPGAGIKWYNNTALTGNTGGGGSHNNMQPTVYLNYIIKY